MTRTLLAIATALFSATAFLAPAAEACISCAYTPEVVSAGEKTHAARSYERKSASVAGNALAARLSKERAAAAKAQLIAKKMEAAKTAKADQVEPAKTAAVETQPVTESKPVAAALPVAAETAAVEETKVAQDVGCKKFISAIGMTVTVPCK